MNDFNKLIDDIKTLKIQGAENVAREALNGIGRYEKEHGKLPSKLLVKKLLATRSTEPMMRNAVRYFMEHAKHGDPGKVLSYLMHGFDEADGKIASYAAGLITAGGTYFTHCHSSTVIEAFLWARKDGKQFSVHNTETRPLYQGRLTAEDLAANNIPVVHGVDSAARVLLKDCKAVFLGADALLSDGKVANKIGSEMVAELAFERDIPVYILANSWKFTKATSEEFQKRLEKRSASEVWERPPKGVEVMNNAFEFIDPRFITAVITEQGIRDSRTGAQELAKRHL
ncbi:translation initiation factor eIF-2B [Candidatus Woesearchaeota archaeon]|nr:translation initiation factor eIF-2B [Candidatus Woesearchaeota archaeon]